MVLGSHSGPWHTRSPPRSCHSDQDRKRSRKLSESCSVGDRQSTRCHRQGRHLDRRELYERTVQEKKVTLYDIVCIHKNRIESIFKTVFIIAQACYQNMETCVWEVRSLVITCMRAMPNIKCLWMHAIFPSQTLTVWRVPTPDIQIRVTGFTVTWGAIESLHLTVLFLRTPSIVPWTVRHTHRVTSGATDLAISVLLAKCNRTLIDPRSCHGAITCSIQENDCKLLPKNVHNRCYYN